VDLRERMDDPGCDRELLFNTLRDFAVVNGLVAGWRRVYARHLRPVLQRSDHPARILDIGCGGGDIPRALLRWARADGITAEITAIDTDPRVREYMAARSWPEAVAFRQVALSVLVEEGRTFDVVISNNLLHHLSTGSLGDLLRYAIRVKPRLVVFNDIRRSAWAYRLFRWGFTPFFRRSFIVPDGLTSIRRSFTLEELRAVSPRDWTVRRQFPFRLLLVWERTS
jgi:2-polyprenyl-3-methyl-5-hydroxy-6-metoxy-1,4-benzoquinol methylase